MNKQTNNIFVGCMLLVATTLAGCIDGTEVPIAAEKHIIAFSGDLPAVLTRAAIESGADGITTLPVAGIQLLRGADGSSPAYNTLAGVTTTATLTAGVMMPAAVQVFSADGTAANFLAYYPAGAYTAGSGANPSKVVWDIDGVNDDIIVSSAISKGYTYSSTGSNTINFVFNHQLARVKLSIVATDQAGVNVYGNLTSAVITIPTKVEMSVAANGATSFASTSVNDNTAEWATLDFGALTLQAPSVGLPDASTVSSKEFMIFPASATKGGVITLTFEHIGAKEYAISDLELIAGKITYIVATISEQEVTLAGEAGELNGTGSTNTGSGGNLGGEDGSTNTGSGGNLGGEDGSTNTGSGGNLGGEDGSTNTGSGGNLGGTDGSTNTGNGGNLGGGDGSTNNGSGGNLGGGDGSNNAGDGGTLGGGGSTNSGSGGNLGGSDGSTNAGNGGSLGDGGTLTEKL